MNTPNTLPLPSSAMALLLPIARLGRWVVNFVAWVGLWGEFCLRALVGIFTPPWKLGTVLQEIKVIGAGSLPIIIFTSFFTGMVLGLQGYHTLSQVGMEGQLGSAVAISLVTELGPVLCALLVTGQAGSALCAQIGIMRNSEQIDALECMGIDVFNFLVSPKVLAALISVPLLTFIFCTVGIYGGYVAGVTVLGVNAGSYEAGLLSSVTEMRVRMCLVKSLFFGAMVVSICAFHGFSVHFRRQKGAVGVSQATTTAVVTSSVNILLWDYILTGFLLQ